MRTGLKMELNGRKENSQESEIIRSHFPLREANRCSNVVL